MLPADYIQRHLHGAWRLMNGRKDGLALLDISADGFWNSFFAILVALPPLIVSWVSYADLSGDYTDTFDDRLSVVARLALIDLASWILPLIGLAFVVGHLRLADRFVHYVVASNWSTAIIAWIMVLPSVVLLLFPDVRDYASLFSLLLFIGALVLEWRMTNAAIGKGAAVATGFLAGMVMTSFVILLLLQWLLGIG